MNEFQDRVGVGRPSRAFRRSDTSRPRWRRVIGDDGERRGRTVGVESDHWDGRQDAVAFAPVIELGKKKGVAS